MMKCARIVIAKCELEVTEVQFPQIPVSGALIRVLFGGVCHTDLHLIEDEIDVGGGKFIHRRDPSVLGDQFNGLIPGHEISGVLEEFGSGVSDNKGHYVGERVVVFPWIGCQECDHCSAGDSNCCEFNRNSTTDIGMGRNGAYGNFLVVDKLEYIAPVPDHIPMDVACTFTCSALTTYAALQKAMHHLNVHNECLSSTRLLIIGAGGLGLWCSSLAKYVGGSKVHFDVTVADISEQKLELARKHGAHHVVCISGDTDSEEQAAHILRTSAGEKFHVVIDLVGSPVTGTVGLLTLKHSGLLLLVGLVGGALPVSLPVLIGRSITIQGSRVGGLESFHECVRLLSDEKIDFQWPPVTRYPLGEINQVHKLMLAGQLLGRAVIQHEF